MGEPAVVRRRLAFRPPLNPDNLFGHLAATAVPGVEEVRGSTYRRTLRLPGGPGIVELTPSSDHVAATLLLTAATDADAAVAACRFLLDLDADPAPIDAALARDRNLRALIARAPGRRVPRCADGAEMAIRAVLGQQISTAAARTLAGRLAAEFGEPVSDPRGGLSSLFPAPRALRSATPAMPAARQRTLTALLETLTSGTLNLDPGDPAHRERALSVLAAIPGIGPWTCAIVAMRALGDPDAFPATDLGVRSGAAALGLPPGGAALTAHAQAWRPWRAYAVQYLWAALPHAINIWPPRPRGSRSGTAAPGPAR